MTMELRAKVSRPGPAKIARKALTTGLDSDRRYVDYRLEVETRQCTTSYSACMLLSCSGILLPTVMACDDTCRCRCSSVSEVRPETRESQDNALRLLLRRCSWAFEPVENLACREEGCEKPLPGEVRRGPVDHGFEGTLERFSLGMRALVGPLDGMENTSMDCWKSISIALVASCWAIFSSQHRYRQYHQILVSKLR